MSNLSRAGFNEFQVKFCVGKAIPLTDMTYLETLKEQIEERYPAAYQDYLSLQNTVPTKALIAVSKETSELKKQFEEAMKSKNAEVEELKRKVSQIESSKPALEKLLERVMQLESKLSENQEKERRT